MNYLTKEQWQQIQQNIEEGQNQSKRIVVTIDAGLCYIDYIDTDYSDEPCLGVVSIHTRILGTSSELLYNYLGDDESVEEIFLSEIDSASERDAILQKLINNEQAPVRFMIVDAEYYEDDKHYLDYAIKPKIEDADLLTVDIVPEEKVVPVNYIGELIYKNKKYEVKSEENSY